MIRTRWPRCCLTVDAFRASTNIENGQTAAVSEIVAVGGLREIEKHGHRWPIKITLAGQHGNEIANGPRIVSVQRLHGSGAVRHAICGNVKTVPDLARAVRGADDGLEQRDIVGQQ